MPQEPALLTSGGRMPERSQHRVSDSPEGESERPAMGHGQPRTAARPPELPARLLEKASKTQIWPRKSSVLTPAMGDHRFRASSAATPRGAFRPQEGVAEKSLFGGFSSVLPGKTACVGVR